MEALARQIAKAAIVNQPWSALEQEFNLEVRRVAHEQCGMSTEQIANSDFGSVTEHQLNVDFIWRSTMLLAVEPSAQKYDQPLIRDGSSVPFQLLKAAAQVACRRSRIYEKLSE